MIVNFKGKIAEDIWHGKRSRGFPAEPGLVAKALSKLQQVDAAQDLDDLRHPPSNKLHPLFGDRAGQHAIWINGKWRVCFKLEGGNAHDVEITDYH